MSSTTTAGTTQRSAVTLGSGRSWTLDADQRSARHQHQAEVRAEVRADHVHRRGGAWDCSIYGRLSTEAEQRRLAFERVNAVSSEMNAVKALPSCWATADMQDPRRIGIASGESKHTAIHAAVTGGWVNVLIIDRNCRGTAATKSSTMNVRQYLASLVRKIKYIVEARSPALHHGCCANSLLCRNPGRPCSIVGSKSFRHVGT